MFSLSDFSKSALAGWLYLKEFGKSNYLFVLL